MNRPPLRVAVLGEPDVILHGLRDALGARAVVDQAHVFAVADVCVWNTHGEVAARLGLARAASLARSCAPYVVALSPEPARALGLGADAVIDLGAPLSEIRRVVLAREVRPGLELPDELMAVARLLTAGCTNAEIGDVLHLSESSVVRRLRRLYAELGVSNRVGAIRALSLDGDGSFTSAS